MEEVHFKAVFKRCRKTDLYQNRVLQTRRPILNRPCTSTFEVNMWDRAVRQKMIEGICGSIQGEMV